MIYSSRRVNKIKIIMHGAAKEVGRSCIEIDEKNTKIILDAGLKLTEEGTKFPKGMYDLSQIDGVFISHGHLDHCGALPLFDYNGLKAPIFCTKTTAKLTDLLLKDSFKIGMYHHENLGYFVENIKKAVNCIRRINLREKGALKDISFQFYNAGHIPGSSIVKIETQDKKILYTGDINTNDTLLLKKADMNFGPVDILIMETTYGDRIHPERKKVEKELISEIKKAIKKGGSAIIPVFAIGRAQEILLMFAKYEFDAPVYIDGMAAEATDIILSNPKDLNEPDKLRNAYRKVKRVQGSKQRATIVKKQGIFITTSGMLTGGPVYDYVKALYKDPKTSIILTGYQTKGTNGKMLLENGTMFIDGFNTRIKCKVLQFDLSAHYGMDDMKEFVQKVSPKTIVLVHGDLPGIDSIREWAKSKKYNVIAPELEEVITL